MRSPHTSYRWRGERDIEPIKCMRSPTHQLQVERRESHRANQVYALDHTQLQVERRVKAANQVYALTTHQLQVERRERHRANQVYALTHTSYRWRGERDIEPIKCMRSPHTSYRWRGERVHITNQVYVLATHQLQVERRESHRANQVYALTTHQLQVERRESHRANQVYALTTLQLQVRGERDIEPIKCMRSPHTSYRWRGERVI